MNVLLVPAHPGFPGQIPQSRKTVVCCVCVVVIVVECNKSHTPITQANFNNQINRHKHK